MASDWLKWFPGHQELYMNAFLLGAVLCFDVARVDGKPKYFVYSWCWFVLGCFANSLLLNFTEGNLFLLLTGILIVGGHGSGEPDARAPGETQGR